MIKINTIVVSTLFVGFLAPMHVGAFSPETLARAVQTFFPDTPEMVDIARCESGLRQKNANGTVLHGGLGNKMIGLFQLHETYHRQPALAQGYDIDTLLGNLAYTRELYRAQGTVPWNSSKYCWGKSTPTETLEETTNIPLLTKTLRYGMRDSQVRVLQQALNAAGYTATLQGEETIYFGISTFKALIQLQCDEDVACLHNPAKRSGIGVVAGETREIINRLIGTTR